MIRLALLLALTAPALASPSPEPPEPAFVAGCPVTLPDPGNRVAMPRSDCGESRPLAWGASVRDGAGGRR